MKINIVGNKLSDTFNKIKAKIKLTKEKIDGGILCIGIICLTVLEIFALLRGFNGTLLKLVIVIIALAIGITIPSPFKILKK